MTEEFDQQENVHITRDPEGVARDLLHVEEPYESSAASPALAAREYLERFGDALGIMPSELTNFSLPPETSPIDAGVEYRFDQERSQFDMTTVVCAQTYFGLPVWEAGVAVHMRQRPFVVLSAQSTRHVHIDATRPPNRALTRIERLDPETLAGQLGVGPRKGQHGKKGEETEAPVDITIQRQRLVVYRYERDKRTPPEERPPSENEAPEERPPSENEALTPPTTRPMLPLPEVGADFEHRRHYVASEIIFSLGWGNIADLVWRAIVDVTTLTVLYLCALVADVTGLVFEEDPVTANGGPLPDAAAASLNPLRTSVLLPDLSPPAAGTPASV